QAIELLKRAIKANQKHAGAYANLGTAQLGLGLLQEALVNYDRALSIAPRDPEALFNRGNALKGLKRFSDALNSYDRALVIVPNHLGTLVNRGNVLQELGRDQDALISYQAALSIQPHSVPALIGYSHTQHKLGNLSAALQAAVAALTIEESVNTNSTFFTAIKGLTIQENDSGDIAALTMRAMSEPWGDPNDLLETIVGFIKQSPPIKRCIERSVKSWPHKLTLEALFADELLEVATNKHLLCLLENAAACDIEIEKFLTLVRFALLQHVSMSTSQGSENPKLLDFCCALAKQCFLNEYVFFHDEGELESALALKHKLETALAEETSPPYLWLATYATYFPLHTLIGIDKLRKMALPKVINELLQQQVEEPLQELAYADSIKCLTSISDDVSRLVKQQYEENPYPRWMKHAAQGVKTTLHAYLPNTFPHAEIKFSQKDKVDYLIAGCGTGRQAIDVAQSFHTSRLVAVDLSLKSLCYALRKTAEFSISHIEYAQADIMELGQTGWKFDAIESVGVLHHMADPVAGWRVLASMLRAGGFMKLGFYSEIARRNLSMYQNANAEDIRKLRHELMSQADQKHAADIFAMRDFYGTSECRDLLFHVQEHRFNLMQIKEILAELGLKMLGFQLPTQVMRQYEARFPEDRTRNNLDCWHVFEQENPYTFISMYQFWVQKIT
ncbi:MAG: tetratricopeptide repeat protein, partial [Betaproteobacteria bacterium]|nr:tetratricopeptide repeat protein [Betaproteobacteria bacterium]